MNLVKKISASTKVIKQEALQQRKEERKRRKADIEILRRELKRKIDEKGWS